MKPATELDYRPFPNEEGRNARQAYARVARIAGPSFGVYFPKALRVAGWAAPGSRAITRAGASDRGSRA